MAIAVGDSIALTGDPLKDGLLQGGSWTFAGPRVLTYSLNLNFDYNAQGQLIPPLRGGATWAAKPAMTAALSHALDAWSNVIDVQFQKISSGSYIVQSTADIAVAMTYHDLQNSIGAIAMGFFPDPATARSLVDDFGYTAAQYPRPEGDVLLDDGYSGFDYLYEGGMGLWAMIHELGHALGLKHPHDDGGSGRPDFDTLGLTLASGGPFDDERYTVMSYSPESYYSISDHQNAGHAATPMPLDILAMQRIYGANMGFHAGDDVYALTMDHAMRTIWDAGGNDTLNAGAIASNLTLDLRPGALMELEPRTAVTDASGMVHEIRSETILGIAYNCTIENAIGGSGNNLIIGNDADNLLQGAGGNDTLLGGAGNDTLLGGIGADVFMLMPSDHGVKTIADFQDGDLIELAGLALSSPMTLGDGTALAQNRSQLSVSDNVTTVRIGVDDSPGFDIALRLAGSFGANQLYAFGNEIGFNHAPTGTLRIAGVGGTDPIPGQVLSAENNLADSDTLGAFSYQWTADGVALPGATASSFTLGRAQAGQSIQVTASYLDGHGMPETVVSSAVQASAGKAVAFLAYSWREHTLLSAVNIHSASDDATTDAGGAAGLTVFTGPGLALSAARDVPTTEADSTRAAIDVQDAIDILRMIVGLDINGPGRALSPYQALAADFDGNGSVTVNDTIGILRYVVGLGAPEPAWHLLNEADLSVPSKLGLNPGPAQTAMNIDIGGTSPVHAGLAAYLSGDVNGSFAGTPGAQDLDLLQPGYFAALVDAHPELTLAQFGVYPS